MKKRDWIFPRSSTPAHMQDDERRRRALRRQEEDRRWLFNLLAKLNIKSAPLAMQDVSYRRQRRSP